MEPLVTMESLSLSDPSSLDTLPTDVLLIILSYFDTASSVASLASTCKGLYALVSASGWRAFVASCFGRLSLPQAETDEDWRDIARALVSQSHDWDRRAFLIDALEPVEPRRPTRQRFHRVVRAQQSIPGNVIIDAHLQRQGRSGKEMVVWGLGEDVYARVRTTHNTHMLSETWYSHKGSEAGYRAGKDDTTSVSILKSSLADDSTSPQALVGRAGGDLRLLSLDGSGFGRTITHFRPENAADQNSIQACDVHDESHMISAGSRENVLLYSTDGGHDAKSDEPTTDNSELENSLVTKPTNVIKLNEAQGCAPFEFIRSVKFMDQQTIVVAMNKSSVPVQCLTLSPTGLEISSTAKLRDGLNLDHSIPRTVRALMPVNTNSVTGRGGNSLMSSWDDGTIRLQDLRTPSPFDRIYQDNFEISTPINALLSYGLERFIAGSAHSNVLKIFDFRWSKGYYYTEALPCDSNPPYPVPKHPAPTPYPVCPLFHSKCDHLKGVRCRWHILSRDDFYRPNCNLYLPISQRAGSTPIYSLAKPSDISPTIYAGVSGTVVEMNLRSNALQMSSDAAAAAAAAPPPQIYSRRKGITSMVETGTGEFVTDITKCQGMPDLLRQSSREHGHTSSLSSKRHRLDELFQKPIPRN
ncbi:hypothetical protein F4778DRAFT_506860 [Xylariomycetidae sp. FL2044]|nr:hypothetical protein F4778DRAFT_506860 [Xylariomycetidae sp. FL2044]